MQFASLMLGESGLCASVGRAHQVGAFPALHVLNFA
jgi:hypothetical protein